MYIEQFKVLLNDVDGQSEEALISFFIGGLKTDLKNELTIVCPTTLQKAFALAKIYKANRGTLKNKYQ